MGRNPRWEESFEITPNKDYDDINFEVKNDGITDSEMVGAGVVKVHQLLVGKGTKLSVQLLYKNQKAGELLVES